MSFEVTITADSIASLGAKALALGAQLSGKHDPVMPELQEPMTLTTKPARTRAKAVEADTGNAPATGAEPQLEGTGSGEASPATTTTSAPSTPPETAKEPSATTLDFDKDVRPAVIGCVQKRGKAFVEEILAQFGVVRASELSSEQLPELVGMLQEAMA